MPKRVTSNSGQCKALAWCAVAYLLICPALFGRSTDRATTYSNPEWGIFLHLPPEAALCPTPADERDHGFGVLLGDFNTDDCHDDAHHRSVFLFAFWNCIDETRYLPGVLNMGCAATRGHCQPDSADLEIPGLKSMTGRVKLRDGWIEIVVATQAGKPSPDDPDVPAVNYIFSLRTKPEYLDRDLNVFRTILRTIRFSDPGQRR